MPTGIDLDMSKEIEPAKRLMGALVRMKPKPHDDMKRGDPRGRKSKSPARKRGRAASAKPKTA